MSKPGSAWSIRVRDLEAGKAMTRMQLQAALTLLPDRTLIAKTQRRNIEKYLCFRSR
jgi:hypothetical protein